MGREQGVLIKETRSRLGVPSWFDEDLRNLKEILREAKTSSIRRAVGKEKQEPWCMYHGALSWTSFVKQEECNKCGETGGSSA